MADGSMFPLPREHWLPHQGVKECMSCSSTFSKTLFGSSKDNCRKCGRVVCKQCIKYKINDIRNICKECYQLNESDNNILVKEYENRKKNPYLSKDSLKQYEEQFNINLSIPNKPTQSIHRTQRSHSAGKLSTTSTIPVPHTLLDLTTDIPLPQNNIPQPNIIQPLLKEDTEYNEYEIKEIEFQTNEIPKKRKSFREYGKRKIEIIPQMDDGNSNDNHAIINRESRGSVGSNISVKRNSITITKWLNGKLFDINEKQMKLYENKTYSETLISNTEAMVIRLDGFEFGINITANMCKPFDERFHNAMILTGCDILKQFDAYTIFVQSDEFIIIYPISHYKQKNNYLFGGKISKILSIVSSFASMRFVQYLKKEFENDNKIMENINDCFGSFNGKCFNIGINTNNIFDYIIWRLKCNVRGYHKKILTVNNEFSHGTFIKKEKYFNNIKKKERERITSCCVQIESKNKKYYSLITDKYWQNDFLKEMQMKAQYNNNTLNARRGSKPNTNISFDDSEVFPDIYNTMIIHSGDTIKRSDMKNINIKIPPKPVLKSVPKIPKNSKPIPKYVPKRKSAPVKRDIYSIAKKFESETEKQKHNKMEEKDMFNINTLTLNTNLKIERDKNNKKKQVVEIKNDIFDENNMYNTMIIHDIDHENQKIEKVNILNQKQVQKSNKKQKQFFKPKQKAYHHNKIGNKTKNVNKNNNSDKNKNVSRDSNKNNNNSTGKPVTLDYFSNKKVRPSMRNKIVKPASSNPNYKSNYTIQLNNDSQKTKPKSTKERIKEFEQR